MKTIKSLSIGLLFLTLFSMSCDDEDVVVYDKVERLMITQSNFLEISSNDTSQVFLGYLTDFSVEDYKNITSAKFVVMGGCNNSNKLFRVYLFDVTNNKIIDGSEVTFGTDDCNATGYSEDIKDKFPAERIDIGIALNGLDVGSLWGSYLYLYRN
jgi:hypothetical protein